MAARTVNKEIKKQEILQAALEVFSRCGFAKTKMIDVANTAGIGKGTIYEYFRSKEEIFAEAFLFMMKKSDVLLEEALSKTDDPVEKLSVIIQIWLVQFLEEAGDFMGIMMDFWAEGIRAKNKKILDILNLKGLYEQYRQLINDILQEGVRSGAFGRINTLNTASAIIAALDGLMLQWILDPDLFDLKQVAEDFTEGLLNGIKKTG
ncbi:MAG TPA: TetR/AcrR family transcriptional regulator [Calditrichaeota bacterium]|nr:TetR/AcrR family transcriptional regulator [Calditrichota bacterium]